MRDVLTLDGEGYSPQGVGGPHWYTLLNAYDSRYHSHRFIESWEGGGLESERILEYLLGLRHGRHTIVCGFFLNYDIAMWLKDVDPATLTALWSSGWVVWHGPRYGQTYYLEYIPSKLFFVGRYSLDMGRDVNKHEWPQDKRSLLVYDVASFSQKSFVKTLADWQSEIGISDSELAAIGEMKLARSSFTPETREEQAKYNRDECYWLARYVQALDKTLRAEGVYLNSWHGPGAVASFYMKREGIADVLADSSILPVRDATLSAYYGGRSELLVAGRHSAVHNYDINSAYPAASTQLPSMVDGIWHLVNEYDSSAKYALWHVRWDLRGTRYRVMPFPFRHKRGVFYPDCGEGWYHASEVQAALRHYGAHIQVINGVRLVPCDARMPFRFVLDLARQRVEYKRTADRRAVVYKFALNSIYGKLAQHTTHESRVPDFQCYYAAGFITAWCRARLLDFIWQEGYDDSDIIMLATDGVFCERERSALVGEELGAFSYQGALEDAYIVQPGVWYTPSGARRTRGFGAKTLDYATIAQAWAQEGPWSTIPYKEQRFVGMGGSVGRGAFAQYGTWQDSERVLSLYPSRKYVVDNDLRARYVLAPSSMPGMCSEPYTPRGPNNEKPAIDLYEMLVGLVSSYEQPDIE